MTDRPSSSAPPPRSSWRAPFTGPLPTTTLLCPTHGFRFDPAQSFGCIRCRSSAPPAPRTTARRTFLLGAAGIAGGGLCAGGAYAAYSFANGLRASDPRADVTEITYATDQRGALFVPALAAGAAPSPSPLLLLLDPGGNSVGIVKRYAAAAARHGWYVASSSEVSNGTADAADTEALLRLHDYVVTRYPIDDARVFSGGFSGGACGAYHLAIVRPDVVRGAIVECGHMGSWRAVGAQAVSSLRFYLYTRDHDFNRPATHELREVMAAKGCRVTEVEGTGGHMGMGEQEISDAMDWLLTG